MKWKFQLFKWITLMILKLIRLRYSGKWQRWFREWKFYLARRAKTAIRPLCLRILLEEELGPTHKHGERIRQVPHGYIFIMKQTECLWTTAMTKCRRWKSALRQTGKHIFHILWHHNHKVYLFFYLERWHRSTQSRSITVKNRNTWFSINQWGKSQKKAKESSHI